MPTKAVRIGFGPLPGDWDGFDKEQRARIEAAYGRTLNDEIWQRIEAITGPLTFSAPITKTAASLSTILKKTKKLTDAAQSLRMSILADAPSEAVISAETLSDVYIKHF